MRGVEIYSTEYSVLRISRRSKIVRSYSEGQTFQKAHSELLHLDPPILCRLHEGQTAGEPPR